MKHVILGSGNLGKDLLIELNARGGKDDSVRLLSKSKGFDALNAKNLETFRDAKPDVLWYCIGGGSVDDAIKNPFQSLNLNYTCPVLISQLVQKTTKIVLFSSDYAADQRFPNRPDLLGPPLSEYANQKQALETKIKSMDRDNTSIVRIGSLYGHHKPERTFPGKVIRNYSGTDEKIRLPSNIVVPTPSRWLAAMLVSNLKNLFEPKGPIVHHCSPTGGVSVRDWGKFALANIRDGRAFDLNEPLWYDEQRPYVSGLGCSFSDQNYHWYELWDVYFKTSWYAPR